MNKKGVATALVDFYVTVLIIVVIIIFFFVLHLKTEKATLNVTGEQIGLDATQIALLYAQTPVETSLGTMSFAEFIILAATDDTLKDELKKLTENFFTAYTTKLPYKLSWKITCIQNGNEDTILKGDNYNINSVVKGEISAPSSIFLPMPKPGDIIQIEISTLDVTGEQIGLDARQIALLYAQTPVETSLGTMSFAEFIILAATDDTLKDELKKLTENFFTAYTTKLPYKLSWKITCIQNGNEDTILKGDNYNINSVVKGEISAPSSIFLPMPKPGDIIQIEISTLSITSESIQESYQLVT